MTMPFVVCLCPTYGRPLMAANAWACFEAQDYPAGSRSLLILDDAGQLLEHRSAAVCIRSAPSRYPSLPAKYAAAVEIALARWTPDILMVWEDDDVMLPQAISSTVAALQSSGKAWSHPSRVWSDYPGRIVQEPAAGRFHGSLAFTRAGLDAVGGWPETKRADFDQQLIRRLIDQHGEAAHPAELSPQYVFRWRTGHPHGQSYMRDPGDEGWYDRYPAPAVTERIDLKPLMDPDTRRIYETLGY